MKDKNKDLFKTKDQKLPAKLPGQKGYNLKLKSKNKYSRRENNSLLKSLR